MQRLCIALWTGIRGFPDGYDSLYPDVNLPRAILNAFTIDFFNAAFDWRNMAYEFLPFVYGSREKWDELGGASDVDPLFEAFLKAGAARVRLPVTPAYTEAVLWYQLTGEIRPAGEVPLLTTSGAPEAALYNAYLREIDDAEALPDIDRDVDIDVDDPASWLVRLPTTLVWLQQEEWTSRSTRWATALRRSRGVTRRLIFASVWFGRRRLPMNFPFRRGPSRVEARKLRAGT